MSWEYREPRAITSLMVLPVPFGVTTQEDAPVDIKVNEFTEETMCMFLRQWNPSIVATRVTC